jgi:hypothetical protein
MFPELTTAQIALVIDAVKGAVQESANATNGNHSWEHQLTAR